MIRSIACVLTVLPLAASAANVAYVPQSGDGPWDWATVGNWYNNSQATASQTALGRLPGSSDHIYLYSAPLTRNPWRIPAGTVVDCTRVWIGCKVYITNAVPAATDPVMLEICGGALTNRESTWLGYYDSTNGPTRKARIDITSGSWTSLGAFNIGAAASMSYMNIGENGVLEVPSSYLGIGFSSSGGATVTNKGLISAYNIHVGTNMSWAAGPHNNTTGIVVNVGTMNIENDLMLGNATNSCVRFENRGTLNVGHHLHTGFAGGVDVEIDNYGVISVYREMKLGMGKGAKPTIYRHHPGATLSKTTVAQYREYYVGYASPAVFSVDGGTMTIDNASEKIFLTVNSVSGTGRVEVVNGGTLSMAGDIYAAYTSWGKGTVLVDGEGSRLVGGGRIYAGNQYEYNPNTEYGTGDVIVRNGGKMDLLAIYLGHGNAARGNLTVENGGSVKVGNLCMGYYNGTKSGAATGTVVVAGANSTITNVAGTLIGVNKATNFGLLKMEGGQYFFKTNSWAFQLGVNASSSAGEIRGWGRISHDWLGEGVSPPKYIYMTHHGKVVADGEGQERDLDMGNMWSVSPNVSDLNLVGVNGWYARNKGRLRFPHIQEIGRGANVTRCVGDASPRTDDPRLVNSFRFTLTGGEDGKDKCLWAELYAPDRSDIPAGLPSQSNTSKVIAVYRAGCFGDLHTLGEPSGSMSFASASVKFHYDPTETGYERVRVLRHDGTENGSWKRIGSAAFSAESPFVSTAEFAESESLWNFGWFAVVAKNPEGMSFLVR